MANKLLDEKGREEMFREMAEAWNRIFREAKDVRAVYRYGWKLNG